MATLRVKNTGDGTDGTTWAKAYQTIALALAAASGGDTIWVSSAHAGAVSAVQNITKASAGNPVSILCVTESGASGAGAITTGAVETQSGAFAFNISGDLFVSGITFRTSGSSSSSVINFATASGMLEFENCTFDLAGTGGSALFGVGTRASGCVRSRTIWRGCTFRYQLAGQLMALGRNQTQFIGCNMASSASSGVAPTTMFDSGATYGQNSGGRHEFIDCDFSLAGSGKTLFGGASGGPQASDTVFLINCKLGASVTISAATSDASGLEIYLKNTDAGGANINYGYGVRKYGGSIDIDINQFITTSADGGGADEAQSYSWKISGGAGAKFMQPFRTEWFIMRYGTLGSAKTVSWEILSDQTAPLNDNEVWIEAIALTDSGDSMGTHVNDRCDLLQVSPAAQDAGIGATHWTKGTATNTWQSQKLVSGAFTPQKKGYVMARLCVAANKVIYANPNFSVV